MDDNVTEDTIRDIYVWLRKMNVPGRPDSIPEYHGNYYGVHVWSVIYSTDQGQYKIWVTPDDKTAAPANDGTLPPIVNATAFAAPEDFATWVLGVLVLDRAAREQARGELDPNTVMVSTA